MHAGGVAGVMPGSVILPYHGLAECGGHHGGAILGYHPACYGVAYGVKIYRTMQDAEAGTNEICTYQRRFHLPATST
jgi:hypothetical protein